MSFHSRRIFCGIYVLAALAAVAGGASRAEAAVPDWSRLAEPEVLVRFLEGRQGTELADWPCLDSRSASMPVLGSVLRRLEDASGSGKLDPAALLRLRDAAGRESCYGNLLATDAVHRVFIVSVMKRSAQSPEAARGLIERVAEARSLPLTLDRLAFLFTRELGERFRDPRGEPEFSTLPARRQHMTVMERGLGNLELLISGDSGRAGALALAEKPALAPLIMRLIQTDRLLQLQLPIAVRLAANAPGTSTDFPDGEKQFGSVLSPFTISSANEARALLSRAASHELENLLGFDYSQEGYRRRGIERGRFSWHLAAGSVRLGEPIPLRLDVEDPGGGFDIARPVTFVGPKEAVQEPPVVARVTGPSGATIAAFERTPVGLGKASVSLLAEVKAKSKTSYWLFLAVDREGAPLLSKPGEYRIEIDYHPMVVKRDGRRAVDRSIVRSSGPLVLRVEAIPEPAQACYQEIGRTGFTWVLTDARGLHFWEVGDEDLEAIGKGLASLRATCAGTVYAPYLDLARGRLVLRRLDHRLSVTDDPALAAALKELGSRESFPLAPMAREVSDRLTGAAAMKPFAGDLRIQGSSFITERGGRL